MSEPAEPGPPGAGGPWPEPAGEVRGEPAADPALSIPRDRLAGSTHCPNCGTTLVGPYCHYCGQPDRRLRRFFPVLARELLEDVLGFDSRLLRTLKPLLFRPGHLTRDYLDGRRHRYTPPLRLYLFASLILFLLLALRPTDVVIRPTTGSSGPLITIGTTQEGARSAREAAEAAEDALSVEGMTPDGVEDDGPDIIINGERWDRETNPLQALPFAPRWVNDWINDEIEQSPAKAKEIEANPQLFRDKLFDVLPATLFVLLPVAALLFQVAYLLSKRYYVEHLVFALHDHAFLFVALILHVALGVLGDWARAGGVGWAGVLLTVSRIALVLWIPVYFLFALRRVYQQSWPVTVVKYGALALSYSMLLLLTSIFVTVASFLLL